MLQELLSGVSVILGSQSPRRKELLASLEVDFEVVIKSVDESIPNEIRSEIAAEYVALKKIHAFDSEEYIDEIIITADTVVVNSDNEVLGKPTSAEEAIEVIKKLVNNSHYVHTGVAIKYKSKLISFTSTTKVLFGSLSHEEIKYYVNKYKPYDKAGSYGIQEWIGRVGVTSIEGSYENVMGLPTAELYQVLRNIK